MKIQDLIDKAEEGCRNKFDIISYGYVTCGETYNNVSRLGDNRVVLCPTCQEVIKNLEQAQQIQDKQVEELIKLYDCMNPKHCGCDRCPSCNIFYKKLGDKLKEVARDK